MSKSIYDEALEDLNRLIEQANARKLSNEIVASRWGISRIRKVINQAKKQEKLLKLYQRLSNDVMTIFEFRDIKKQIKELENE